MKQLGLIGTGLSHSFSKDYFTQKFKDEQLENISYELFDLTSVEAVLPLIGKYNSLIGLNVTSPFKESVVHLMDELDEVAADVNAVNCIKIIRNEVSTGFDLTGKTKSFKLKGFNTDVVGFSSTLFAFFSPFLCKKVLLLGTGGASKAVSYVLNQFEIGYLQVSRNPLSANQISYSDITKAIIKEYPIIINATPVGMYPHEIHCPEIPFKYLTSSNFLFDLIYNPSETNFIKNGTLHGAMTVNGLSMLQLQADAAWSIFFSV